MRNDAAQFALTPFAYQQEAAAPAAANPSVMQPEPYHSQANQNMYPEVYHDVYPLVAEAVNQLTAAGVTPTPEMLNSIVDNIIRNSGMWYEDEEENPYDQNMDAIPVQMGFGRMPYQRRRRRYHNRNTLRDIIRILLLNELFRRGGSHYPSYY